MTSHDADDLARIPFQNRAAAALSGGPIRLLRPSTRPVRLEEQDRESVASPVTAACDRGSQQTLLIQAAAEIPQG